jgi:hypothetical protein
MVGVSGPSQSKADFGCAASACEPESQVWLASMTARGGHAKEPALSRPPWQLRHSQHS